MCPGISIPEHVKNWKFLNMKNIIKRGAYALAFPLALAAYGNTRDFDAKSLDLLFNPSNKITNVGKTYNGTLNGEYANNSSPMPTPSYQNIENIMPNKSEIQRGAYNFDICPKELKDLGPFRLNYQRFREQFQRPYFDMDSIFDNNEVCNSGGFSIITAINTVHTNVEELNRYHLESTNNARTINRKYDLFINNIDEKRCLNMTVAFEEERKSTFGDFLPGK